MSNKILCNYFCAVQHTQVTKFYFSVGYLMSLPYVYDINIKKKNRMKFNIRTQGMPLWMYIFGEYVVTKVYHLCFKNVNLTRNEIYENQQIMTFDCTCM